MLYPLSYGGKCRFSAVTAKVYSPEAVPESGRAAGGHSDRSGRLAADSVLAAAGALRFPSTGPCDTLAPSSHTDPTRGLKDLLRAVWQRLSGTGGEVASLIRLHTQFGGGRTHGLIGLAHAVRGMKAVRNVAEFVDPSLLPKGKVRVAAIDHTFDGTYTLEFPDPGLVIDGIEP